jgi:hypothetical protein
MTGLEVNKASNFIAQPQPQLAMPQPSGLYVLPCVGVPAPFQLALALHRSKKVELFDHLVGAGE